MAIRPWIPVSPNLLLFDIHNGYNKFIIIVSERLFNVYVVIEVLKFVNKLITLA